MNRPLTSRDWFGKASAGLVLGFAIALGLAGLMDWMTGVEDLYMDVRGSVAMWLMGPVWCAILSFCFLFRSGSRAWAILGIVAAVIWALLYFTGFLS